MPVKVRQRLGKYRIDRKLGEGGFATVYGATDTIEGIPVALKIPHSNLVTAELIEQFRHEVRLCARLKHSNILPLKNADFINSTFVMTFPLGLRTLEERLQKRMSNTTALNFAQQMLEAAAYAHEGGIIHCDIKPENLILFEDDILMLMDFGIAKVTRNTVDASGSGTIGYLAPEQALGRPSLRSDVFSLGLVLYRMFTGVLPGWPFAWPLEGSDRLKRRIHPQMIAVLQRAVQLEPRKRYANAGQMLTAFRRAKPRALEFGSPRSWRARTQRRRTTPVDWRAVRQRQFLREFGRSLHARHTCDKCEGPVSESMQWCPWCRAHKKIHKGNTTFPHCCPRCKRGMKSDWQFCPWCYGPGFQVISKREYPDQRYDGRCRNPKCKRKSLMPFMRYCPWCRRKVAKKWEIEDSRQKCPSCSWGVVKAYWSYCPWCGKSLAKG